MLIGPPVELSADLAVPVGMALHELTTNAVRHGALSVPAGYVRVRWTLDEHEGARRLHMEWREFAGPRVHEPRNQGFGSTLLQRVLPMQCKADVEVQYASDGVRFRMDVPLVARRLVPAY
jgi:two-component sensor histidine kinase